MPHGSTKVQVVKSVRTGTIIRQRVLRHIGTARNDNERDVWPRRGWNAPEKRTKSQKLVAGC